GGATPQGSWSYLKAGGHRRVVHFGASSASRSSGVSTSSAALGMGTRTTRSALRRNSTRAPTSPRSSARSRNALRGKIAGTPLVPAYSDLSARSEEHTPELQSQSK